MWKLRVDKYIHRRLALSSTEYVRTHSTKVRRNKTYGCNWFLLLLVLYIIMVVTTITFTHVTNKARTCLMFKHGFERIFFYFLPQTNRTHTRFSSIIYIFFFKENICKIERTPYSQHVFLFIFIILFYAFYI